MNERAPARHPTPFSAALAGLASSRSRTPQIIGALTYLAGAVDIASGLARAWRTRLHPLSDVIPGAVAGAASAVTVILGILLLLLAHALRRRKRRAWRAAVVLLSLSVVLHLAQG